jgi:hypothetical protein
MIRFQTDYPSSLGLRLLLMDVAVPFLLAYQYRLLPAEIDLTVMVPFCALIGGLSGAARALLLNEPERFPKAESVKGALYGALFGFFFVCFGTIG